MLVSRRPGAAGPPATRSYSPSMLFRWIPVPGTITPEPEPVEDESEAKKILRLMDQLEDDDDVQDVYANFDIPEQVLEAATA